MGQDRGVNTSWICCPRLAPIPWHLGARLASSYLPAHLNAWEMVGYPDTSTMLQHPCPGPHHTRAESCAAQAAIALGGVSGSKCVVTSKHGRVGREDYQTYFQACRCGLGMCELAPVSCDLYVPA